MFVWIKSIIIWNIYVKSIVLYIIFISMFTKESMLNKLCNNDQSCQCSFVSNTMHPSNEDDFFLKGAFTSDANSKLLHSNTNQSINKNKARKSLKPHKNSKQNEKIFLPSIFTKQINTCTSSNYFKNQNSQLTVSKPLAQKCLPRNSSSALTNYLSDSAGNSNIMILKERVVEVKKQLPTNAYLVKKFSTQNHLRQNMDQQQRIKTIDRVQSSQNLIASRQMRQQLPRSQFVNVQLDKSLSKLTHKLTDLNFKCTESINDSQSLRISQVVSQSDSSGSGSNRTETFPKRIKDLMHIKYSKIEGRKY